MRRLMLLALLCALPLAAWPQNSVVDEEDRVRKEARNALWWGDFDELERLHALYQQPGQRTAAGRSKLVLFRDGLSGVLSGPEKANELFFANLEALTGQWAQAHPQSALARVLHAEVLRQHAWWYRGSGYAKSVPPDAWRDFARYTQQGIDDLARHKEVVMRSSSGHVTLLALGRAAGWEHAALMSVAKAGLALNPDDESLYRELLISSLPKWGGSAVLVDRTINELAKLSAPLHGEILYARMYAWVADWEFEHHLFADSGASWPRMKTGFEQQIQRYPAPVNLNGFAHFACLARDKPVLLDLLERIGPKPDLGVWGSNAARTWDTCRRWAAEQ